MMAKIPFRNKARLGKCSVVHPANDQANIRYRGTPLRHIHIGNTNSALVQLECHAAAEPVLRCPVHKESHSPFRDERVGLLGWGYVEYALHAPRRLFGGIDRRRKPADADIPKSGRKCACPSLLG